MAEVTRRSYPSISAKNWWDLRRRLTQSIPETLDVDFLRTALGVGEKHAKNLMRQLLGVGLIDESGAPTELANQWKDDAGYPVACRRILQAVYPQALLDASPPPLPNPALVEQWFATNTSAGRIAATRMASLYVIVAAADPSGQRRESPSDVDATREKTSTPSAGPAPQKTTPNDGPPPETTRTPEVGPPLEKTRTPDVGREKTRTPDVESPLEKTRTPDVGPPLEKTRASDAPPARGKTSSPVEAPPQKTTPDVGREKTGTSDVGPPLEKTRTPDVGPSLEKTRTPDVGPPLEKTIAPDVEPARAMAVGDERSRLSRAQPGDDGRWIPPSPKTPSTESSFARARNRYVKGRWWVVALSILVGGIAGFAWAALMPDVYVAETAVIATQSPVTADQIGPIAETAFSTDPVLQPVIDRLDLQGTPASLISTGALEARSQANGPALLITGRASDPVLAADLANAATEAFVTVAEQKGLGTFAPFESVGPGVLQPHHMSLLILLGMLAGAGLGLLVLVVVFFLRDPIVSEEDARRVFSPDAAFQLQVRARRAAVAREDPRHQEDAEFDESSNAVFSMLSEAVRDHAERDGRGASAVIVDGGDSVWAAAAVARMLEARVDGNGTRREPPDRFSISSSDPRLSEILGARDAVVAIVPSGAPRRSLQHLDEEVHSLGGKFRVLVFVDPSR